MVVLLDTNIISYQIKEHSLAAEYDALIGERLQAISFTTVGELYAGAQLKNWGPAKFATLDRITSELIVLQSSLEICKMYARVLAIRKPRPIPTNDAWIAATALAYQCPLATHNPSDFSHIPDLNLLTVHE